MDALRTESTQEGRLAPPSGADRQLLAMCCALAALRDMGTLPRLRADRYANQTNARGTVRVRMLRDHEVAGIDGGGQQPDNHSLEDCIQERVEADRGPQMKGHQLSDVVGG